MKNWIALAVILAILWFVVMPAVGIPQQMTVVSILFVLATLLALKWIPQTSKFVSIIPITRQLSGYLALGLFVIGIVYFGWFATFLGGNLNLLGGSVATIGQPTATDTNPLAGSSSATVSIVDIGTNLAQDANYAYRRVGDTAWTTGNGNSISITADVGDEFDIVTAPDNTSWYGGISRIEIPKGYAPRFTVYVGDIADVTSATATSWNEDGSVNGGSNAQGMDANSDYTLEFRLRGVYQDYIGNPFGGDIRNTISCKFNTTTYEDVSVQTTSGADLQTASTPDALTVTSGFKYTTFKLPVITSNEALDYQIYVETTATAPDVLDGNITCFVDDSNVFFNSDTNLYEYGVQDEANAGLGYTANTYNFTWKTS